MIPILSPIGIVLVALFLGAGCHHPVPSIHTFVGPIDGSDMFIALSIVDGEVMAYVCDGHDNSTWLRGTAIGSTLSLTSSGTRLDARWDRDHAEGTVTLANVRYGFEARAATGRAGFYRATETLAGLSYVGGWILLSDGRQRGVVRQGDRLLATPPLDPADLTVPLPDGVHLAARPVEILLRRPLPARPSSQTQRREADRPLPHRARSSTFRRLRGART